ncbi:MAG: tetratricopeptide repeat protein [Desulfovibrio sp.]|nr:tetratricopeptide repeat protein [Desulfovibrio sp.]
MARRKSQKKVSSQRDPSPAACSCEDVTSTAAKDRPADAPVAMVRRSTCILCMLGGLLVGSYLSMMTLRFLDAAPSSPTVQSSQTTQAEVQPTPPMPPEMAQEIARLEKSVQQSPDNAHAWAHLGNLYFDTGQAGQAIMAYERSLSIESDNADVLTDLGIMYREAGDHAKAVECFRRASRIRPGHENALFNEGVVLYYDLHNKEEALAAWQKLLQVNPQARTPDGKSVADMLKTLP